MDSTEKKPKPISAARAAVLGQTVSYKIMRLEVNPVCDLSGVEVTSETAEVHHDPEITALFDAFCHMICRHPDSLETEVANDYPVFKDKTITRQWQRYHNQHGNLLLVDKEAHAKHHNHVATGARRAKEVAYLEKMRTEALMKKYQGFTGTCEAQE